MAVVMTWSPGFKSPRRAVFRLSVALAVKHTRSSRERPNRRASWLRTAKAVRALSSAGSPAPRPVLAPERTAS